MMMEWSQCAVTTTLDRRALITQRVPIPSITCLQQQPQQACQDAKFQLQPRMHRTAAVPALHLLPWPLTSMPALQCNANLHFAQAGAGPQCHGLPTRRRRGSAPPLLFDRRRVGLLCRCAARASSHTHSLQLCKSCRAGFSLVARVCVVGRVPLY